MGHKRSVKGQKLSPNRLQNICLRLFSKQPKKRLNARQISKKLGIKNSKSSIEAILENLERQGKLRFVKDGKYQYLRQELTSESSSDTHIGFVDLTKSGAAYIICENLERDV
ncbi:MAG: ribonuclease R, partial [Saprospiraceae bacterium]|nr:ribonuclease R [Saprospiraceae bacterium]